MQEYECGCTPYMPYMQMMNMPSQYYPMMTMPQEQLENMYPQIYFVVYPKVQFQCEMMLKTYGDAFAPTKEQMEQMIDEISQGIEIDESMEMQTEGRQFAFGGRRLFRDLIGILLIRELLRRRRPFGYPGYGFPGYGYPGYGSPGYF